MKRALAGLALLVVLPGALAGCGRDAAPRPGATVESAGVRIRDAWARSSPSMSTMAAAYMTLESGRPDTLVGAELPDSVAGSVQIHQVVGGPGGEMRMQRVDELALAPGAPVQLRPGAFHLMILALRRPLVEGDTLRVRLRFRQAGVIALPVPVRSL